MIYDVNTLDIMGERKDGDLGYTLFQQVKWMILLKARHCC